MLLVVARAAGPWLAFSTSLQQAGSLLYPEALVDGLLVREEIRAVVLRSQVNWLTLEHFDWVDDNTGGGRNPSVSERAPALTVGFPPSYAEYHSTAKKWQVVPAITNKCHAKWL